MIKMDLDAFSTSTAVKDPAASRPRYEAGVPTGRRKHLTTHTTLPRMKNIINLVYVCATLVLGASLNVLAADSLDDARAVQGNWKPIKAELAGQPMAGEILQTISLKLDQGKYEVFVGEAPDRGTYTIDSTTSPKSMTVIGTEGPNRGRTFPAIYEIKAGTLRICYDLSGAKRPAEFKSLPGTKLYLVTYQLQKQ